MAANIDNARSKTRAREMERREAALKDGEGRSAADLDQLAQAGELATGGQPDEAAESDPPKKRRP